MNIALFRLINEMMRNPFFDALMPALSNRNNIIVPALVVVAFMLYFGRWRTIVCVLALAVAGTIADKGSEKVLKNFFGEKRPYAVLEGVHVHRDGAWTLLDAQARAAAFAERNNAFPSSHAANIAVLAAVFAFWRRKTLFATLPLAFLVGLSRVYTGNHYPLDVLAGWVWGAICGITVAGLFMHLAKRRLSEEDLSAALGLSRERKAFLWVLALWTFGNLAFVHMTHFGLAGDEAQYWDWSRHPDWGYYSKPPMIAWIIGLLTRIGGTNEVAIRSGAVLFASGALAFIYALALRIARRESTALLAVCMSIAMTSSWAGSVMLTIDAPMAFFWIFAMYAFHRATGADYDYEHEHEHEHGTVMSLRPTAYGLQPAVWWIVAGIALGLGMLTKYTMLVLVVSFIAHLILFDRKWLRRPGPYVMLGIMLLAMVPVVYWNVAHDWVSVRHTASIGTRGEKSIGKTIGHVLEFAGGQLGVVSPILFGMFAWSMVAMAKRIWPRRNRTKVDYDYELEHEAASGFQPSALKKRDAAYLFLCAMVLFGFYAIVAFTRKTEPNWPICAYLAAAVAFAWAWHERPRTPRMRKLLYAGVILGCFVGMFSRSTEWLYRASAWLAPANAKIDNVYLGPIHFRAKKEPTNRLFGGCELGRALAKYIAKDNPNPPFICSDNYQFVAWAAFYTEGRPRAYCVNLGDRRYNQYDLWGGWESLVGRDGLLIIGDPPDVAQARIDKALELGAFEKLDGIEVVNVYRQQTLIKVFTIAHLHRYTGYKWRSINEEY